MRLLAIACLAACGGAPPPPSKPTAAECPTIARHVMEIGPIDRWIAEGHEDSTLPIDGVSDRAALEKLFDVMCRETWEVSLRNCIAAQPTWTAVERACSTDKVWWYQPT